MFLVPNCVVPGVGDLVTCSIPVDFAKTHLEVSTVVMDGAMYVRITYSGTPKCGHPEIRTPLLYCMDTSFGPNAV